VVSRHAAFLHFILLILVHALLLLWGLRENGMNPRGFPGDPKSAGSNIWSLFDDYPFANDALLVENLS